MDSQENQPLFLYIEGGKECRQKVYTGSERYERGVRITKEVKLWGSIFLSQSLLYSGIKMGFDQKVLKSVMASMVVYTRVC